MAIGGIHYTTDDLTTVNDDNMQLDDFTRGYIAAIRFTLDEELNRFTEFSDDSLAAIMEDCKAFQEGMGQTLARAYDNGRVHYDADQAGTDFWFTRCGHGVGFWDRGLGDIGAELTAAAKVYGDQWVYEGDDMLLHVA